MNRVIVKHDGNILRGTTYNRIGTGSPNGVVTGNIGDMFRRTDGDAGTTLYIKESSTATNTGWVGK